MKKLTKICIASALAVLLVPFGVGLITARADDVTGQQVLDDTRYSAVGFGSVADIVGILTAITDDISDPTEAEKIKDSFKNFASDFADKYAQNVVDGANKTWENAPNYQVQSAFCIMGKRKLVYPNGESEVQTVYVYKDNNVTEAMPQQFGQYTVAPNSIFLVRDTSWGGVIPVSFPLREGNNFTLFTYNSDYALSILLYPPDNNTYVYDTPNGRETVGFRHGTSWRSPQIDFINNTTNTIVNDQLVQAYEYYGESYYNNYVPTGTLDNLSAFFGTGYWYEGSQGFLRGPQPFYCTTAFFNSAGEFGSGKINDFWSTDPNNVNPSKPPAYVLPDNNPLSGGQTINNNTINNYNDYGITQIDGQLSVDPDILAGALGALVDPDFTGALGGVFGAQPQIGFGFDTPLDLNLPDLFDDFIDSITVYPPVTRPLVPAVTTFSEWDYLPSYTTQTFPVDCQEAAQVLADNITGFTDSMGITSILLILALIGLMTYCIF